MRLSNSELDYIADRILERIEVKRALPEWIMCEQAREILGTPGKPIHQATLAIKLDKAGYKAVRMGKGKAIKSEWLDTLRHY